MLADATSSRCSAVRRQLGRWRRVQELAISALYFLASVTHMVQ
jgi:hypothetical protein